MVVGNPVASPFDDLAAPAVSDRGENPLDPQGQPKFVQITTTVAPMSPTVIPPPTAMGVAGLLFVGSTGRSSKQRLKVGN